MSDDTNTFQQAALRYHEYPKAGKLEIQATKPLGSQRDLALAYSPGVAAPCLAIAQNPELAANYTARGNLVAVITDGSAVLGLGNIGALASKPVMEGKAVLFKKFAGIDVFDIEVNSNSIEDFVNTVINLEPTFGGINLEDIKAPECFEIEKQLREKLKIPVFHDDQHGTAIIVCAAVLNGLSLANKPIDTAKIVVSGAGAAALACLNLLVHMGARKENIWVCDIKGVVYEGRKELMDPYKAVYAQKTDARFLADIINEADVFLGLSAANILPANLLKKMARQPLILALANPTPEIMPELAYKERPDAMICTGRSDYPNQVNNVLCFPYIFKGALDVGATAITEEMKIAAVHAIAQLARELVPEDKENKRFGPNYLIPSPLDQRLLLRIAPAVAQAAMDMNIALRPIKDMRAYKVNLQRYVYKSGLVMKPLFTGARKKTNKTIIYTDGEDERILRAAKIAMDEDLAKPIIMGRRTIIADKLQDLGIKIPDEIIWDVAETKTTKTDNTILAASALLKGKADAILCGLHEAYHENLAKIKQIIPSTKKQLAALSLLILRDKILFLADTEINTTPTIEQLADITIESTKQMQLFDIPAKIGLVGFKDNELKETLLKQEAPLNITNEKDANLLIFPNANIANVTLNVLKETTDALHVGPILLGLTGSIHILSPTITTRGILNMTTIAVCSNEKA